MKRCNLTELLVNSCAHCNGVDPTYSKPYQYPEEHVEEVWA